MIGIQCLMQRWKECVDNQGDLVKKINFVKGIPMIYVNFIVTAIIITVKKQVLLP